MQSRPIIYHYNNYTFMEIYVGGYLNQGDLNIGNCVRIFNMADNTYLITWLNSIFSFVLQKLMMSWISSMHVLGNKYSPSMYIIHFHPLLG